MIQIEMPKYKCHKTVHALKIKGIYKDENGVYFEPQEEQYGPVALDEFWIAKYKPEVGGYYVIYEDGYTSFSPAAAFEAGYSII